MERRWRAPLTWDNAAPRTDLFSPDPGLEDAGAVDPIEEASEWTGLPRTGSPSSEDTATGMAVSDLLDELLMLTDADDAIDADVLLGLDAEGEAL